MLTAQPWELALVVGVLAFIESFAVLGVLVPGVALLAAAATAAGGVGTPLSWVLLAGWIGAVCGDGTSFAIGRFAGPGLSRHPRLAAHRDWLERGTRFFERYGVLGIVIGRFLGPLRPLLPLLAGACAMRPALFFTVNLTTALAWAPVYLLPGYVAGASWADSIAPPSNWPLVALLAAFLAWVTARGLRGAWRAGRVTAPMGRSLAASDRCTMLLRPLRTGGVNTVLSALLAGSAMGAALLFAAGLLTLPWATAWGPWFIALGELVRNRW